MFNFIGARHETALATAREFLDLARAQNDPSAIVALGALGRSTLSLGRVTEADAYCAQIEALYDPELHRPLTLSYGGDPGARNSTYGSWAAWLLGCPDRALARSRKGIAVAREASHSFTLAYVLGIAACFQQMRRDAAAARKSADAAVALTTELEIRFWRGCAIAPQGWALAEDGQVGEGIARVQEGLDAQRATGALMGRPYGLSVLAELQGRAGRIDDALSGLDEALRLIGETGEAYYEPEAHRLKGDLLLRRGGAPGEAEACFGRAIEAAGQQGSRLLELRGATSLGRLWRGKGRSAEAHALLAPIYGGFTEGLDILDLQEARALLDDTRA